MHAAWRIAPDAELRFRFWNEECVLYHGAAGNTHLVPEPVGRLLQALAGAANSVHGLSELVDLHVDDVTKSMQEMRRLGIAEFAA
ncbi:hypothetical protein [Pseudorhodoferax sp. Leaf267]|uniref:hypothetical protein n=1 Tax=Pseudorhodoferax sp. Leaf267 TaxID=1736316 RepID=UPI0006FD7BCD|nr:hypothetical protein [Pseudorhodoferax sp. Leaf267]KQP22025.1 hypothetical protein ASF43_24600 [Pseudorhodoferax sp. Leaf267]